MQLRDGCVAHLRFIRPWVYWTSHAGWISSVATFAFVTVASAAEPYVPARDDEVLETLPSSLVSSELNTLRRRLLEVPNNEELAIKVARRYLQIGNQEGDPRFYGYARAAIQPWWEAVSPPPKILRLRAKLHEKNHLYDEALADLNQFLNHEPRDAQAWIEAANIYRVQGKYAEAWRACTALSGFAGEFPTTLCRVPLQAATGQAEDAYESLVQILPLAKSRWPSTVQWVLTMQAQVAVALGRDEQAERHFREGLALSPQDRYLLREYTDFLLDHGRADEVLPLVRDHIRDNGILLGATIAARRSGNEMLAAEWQKQLANRFEEVRLRGGDTHGKYEARFELELNNDPQRALTIALANWQRQKDTRDTRNVLEAAIAADDPAAARPVLAFLAEHGTQDVLLQRLAQQLKRN